MIKSLFSFDEIPNLLIFDKIDSTSKEIHRMIDNGFGFEGDIVIADMQTDGHGRSGRSWDSQKGNLFASFLLQPNVPLKEIIFVGFLLAKNIIEVINNLIIGQEKVTYKWPNDILLNDKKLAGILIQTLLSSNGKICESIVCGLGINLRHHPSFIESTDLFHELQMIVDKNELLFTILKKFEAEYLTTMDSQDISRIINFLKQNSNLMGKQISVHSGDDIKVGICEDIDFDGNLILTNGKKKEVIYSADIINIL